MSKFQHSKKKEVDPAALASFMAGAETRSLTPPPPAPPATSKPEPAPRTAEVIAPPQQTKAALSSAFLLRLSPDLSELLEYVFSNSLNRECKSKQKLIETILRGGLEAKKSEIAGRSSD